MTGKIKKKHHLHLTERPTGCTYELTHIYFQTHKQIINKTNKKKQIENGK